VQVPADGSVGGNSAFRDGGHNRQDPRLERQPST
jgi:hypothetical protein